MTRGYYNLRQVRYYKSRQLLLQFTTGITNSRQLLLQFTTGITIYDVITIHDSTRPSFLNIEEYLHPLFLEKNEIQLTSHLIVYQSVLKSVELKLIYPLGWIILHVNHLRSSVGPESKLL